MSWGCFEILGTLEGTHKFHMVVWGFVLLSSTQFYGALSEMVKLKSFGSTDPVLAVLTK